MEIGSQNVYSAHPVNVQAALRSDAQIQDRGPDSLPPVSAGPEGQPSGTSTEAKSEGRYLDIRA
jgi:hypothetical protein